MTQATGADPRGRAPMKSASAFRTISEVSTELDVPQHVLRFWETKFPQIRPLKRGGGRRYYRPDDVELLRRIQHLLYKEGYTIKGVQRLLKESRGAAVPDGALAAARAVVDDGPDDDARDPPPGLFDQDSDDPDLLDGEDEGLTPRHRQVLTEVLEDLLAVQALLRRGKSQG